MKVEMTEQDREILEIGRTFARTVNADKNNVYNICSFLYPLLSKEFVEQFREVELEIAKEIRKIAKEIADSSVLQTTAKFTSLAERHSEHFSSIMRLTSNGTKQGYYTSAINLARRFEGKENAYNNTRTNATNFVKDYILSD